MLLAGRVETSHEPCKSIVKPSIACSRKLAVSLLRWSHCRWATQAEVVVTKTRRFGLSRRVLRRCWNSALPCGFLVGYGATENRPFHSPSGRVEP